MEPEAYEIIKNGMVSIEICHLISCFHYALLYLKNKQSIELESFTGENMDEVWLALNKNLEKTRDIFEVLNSDNVMIGNVDSLLNIIDEAVEEDETF
jgi:hypothetical protein